MKGCSGLTAIKECVEAGLEPVCFEKGTDVGGLWRYEPPEDGVHSSVYRNTIINTSKEMMSYSDFPIPDHWPTFLHNKVILAYFKMYAIHHNLLPFIQFETLVTCVVPHGSKWKITFVQNGISKEQLFEKVIVCSGHHWQPRMAHFPGMEHFKGEIKHSHYYREAPELKDKQVVVVGIGNSAVDIAVEASYYADQVYLSSRRSAWVATRYTVFGAAADQTLSRVFYLLPIFLRNYIFRLALYFTWGNMKRFGLNPKHAPFSAHPTISAELPARIGTGTIVMKPNISKIQAESVTFDDETTVDADVIILCTGYEIGFPFLDAKSIIGLDRSRVQLYKYVWPIEYDNIAFVGLVQPWGAIMPLSELQARWIAQVFAGKPLVNSDIRQRDVIAKKRAIEKRYVQTDRHTIQVDAGPYMDEIAFEVGCVPHLSRYFFTDNALWRQLIFGCWNPHQYRLNGPGAWEGSRDAIVRANKTYDYNQWKGLHEESLCLEIK